MSLVVKNLPANVRGLIKRYRFDPWVGKSPGRRHSNPLQYSCLENPHTQRSLAGYSPQGHRVGHDRSNLAHNLVLYAFLFKDVSFNTLC